MAARIQSRAAAGQPGLEHGRIDRGPVHPKQVSAIGGDQHGTCSPAGTLRLEGPTQVKHVGLHSLDRAPGRPLAAYYLALQSDANLVIYPPSGPATWTSNTVSDTLWAGGTLAAGQDLWSPNGQYELIMQTDGKLVEYIYPLKTDGKAVETLEKFSIGATIKSQHGVLNVYSPSHSITLKRINDRSVAEFWKQVDGK